MVDFLANINLIQDKLNRIENELFNKSFHNIVSLVVYNQNLASGTNSNHGARKT